LKILVEAIVPTNPIFAHFRGRNSENSRFKRKRRVQRSYLRILWAEVVKNSRFKRKRKLQIIYLCILGAEVTKIQGLNIKEKYKEV
jgi:hypothetical protein